jgi:hypothetical protein
MFGSSIKTLYLVYKLIYVKPKDNLNDQYSVVLYKKVLTCGYVLTVLFSAVNEMIAFFR